MANMASRGRVSCGLDIGFTEDIEESIMRSSQNGYDFICTKIVKEGCEPFESAKLDEKIGGVTKTSFLFHSQEWAMLVVGKLSSLAGLTSFSMTQRAAAETALKQELRFAAFLSLPAALVELDNENCSNIARIVYSFLHEGHHNLHIWVKVPLQSQWGDDDTWQWWNKFRSLCDHHKRIGLALELTPDLPSQLERWSGEPVRVLYIPTSVFLSNKKGYPVLSRAHQDFVAKLFKLNCQVVLSGKNLNITDGVIVYHQYLDHLYQSTQSIGQYERFAQGYEDYLQAPLQPLMDNLESSTYEIFEKDPIKYKQYEEAVYRCLLDIVPDSEAEEKVVVIMVLGAGRGPLVRMSIKGAQRANRRIKLYAVEKNKNAAVFLEHLKTTEWKDENVTIVSADMRQWSAPELADIVVSELLGSFGDNELSPECLDGANRFLKPSAISIPQSYTSYISPISSHKLHNEIRGVTSLDKNKPPEAASETPYVVRIHNYHELTSPVPLFTFNHPNWNADGGNPNPEFFGEVSPKVWDDKFQPSKYEVNGIDDALMKDGGSDGDGQNKKNPDVSRLGEVTALANDHNCRHRTCSFKIPFNTVMNGFAGYFRCSLYKDVEISIEPSTHSPGMFSWFPIFFPLHQPVQLSRGSVLTTEFWRCSDEKKVWYEWCIVSPQTSQIHNPSGRSYTIGL